MRGRESERPIGIREKERQLSSDVGPRARDEHRSSNEADRPALILSCAAYACSFVERLATPLQKHGIAFNEKGVFHECLRASLSWDNRTNAISCKCSNRAGERFAARPAIRSTFPKLWHSSAGYSSGPNSGNRRPTRSNRRASFLCDESPSDPAAGRKPPSVACAMSASAISRSSSKLPGQS
jgi:hypothetical protein